MKKAFTLIELLVYMAIMSFIIIVAGRAFSDSTSMRVRTQNMTKATEEVNKVAAILREDISQLGSKSWKVNNTTDNFLVAENVYYNLTATPPDSSSYNLDKSNANWHKFVFHKVHYKDNGECGAVLKVTWEVKSDSSLWRRCVPINDTKCPNSLGSNRESECPDSLIMATGVEKFTLLPSKPVNPDTLLFPPLGQSTFKLIDRAASGTNGNYFPATITQNGNLAKISGFTVNENTTTDKKRHQIFVAAGNQTSTSYTNCHKFDFKKDTVYAIQFKTPINVDGNNVPDDMALFKPGKDHIAVGLVNTAVTNYPKVSNTTDFIFWPPQTADTIEQNHYMEFSVPAPAPNTCVVFEFSFYKPSTAYGGTLIIEDFQVMKKNDKAYNFADSNYVPPVAGKKYVKAFRLDLKVKRKSEIGNIEKMVIPTPNNGIKAEGS